MSNPSKLLGIVNVLGIKRDGDLAHQNWLDTRRQLGRGDGSDKVAGADEMINVESPTTTHNNIEHHHPAGPSTLARVGGAALIAVGIPLGIAVYRLPEIVAAWQSVRSAQVETPAVVVTPVASAPVVLEPVVEPSWETLFDLYVGPPTPAE